MLHFIPRLLGLRPTFRTLGPVVLGALGLVATGCGGDSIVGPTNELGPRDSGMDLGRDLGQDEDLGPDGDVMADASTSDLGMVECEEEAPEMLGSEAGRTTLGNMDEVEAPSMLAASNSFGSTLRTPNTVLTAAARTAAPKDSCNACSESMQALAPSG